MPRVAQHYRTPIPPDPGRPHAQIAVADQGFLARGTGGRRLDATAPDFGRYGMLHVRSARRGNAARPEQLRARLHADPRGATGADGAARAAITGALVATLSTLASQVKALEAEIAAQLAAHPDAHIFTSLPRAGTLRTARLLAETGDCRARFPDPESLTGLAGAAPVTRRSGKHISVSFRWAVNRQLRDAVCDFAGDSRHASPWAAAIYDAARARGKDHPHAVRILALCDLALLAARHRLRHGQAQRPAARPGPAARCRDHRR